MQEVKQEEESMHSCDQIIFSLKKQNLKISTPIYISFWFHFNDSFNLFEIEAFMYLLHSLYDKLQNIKNLKKK